MVIASSYKLKYRQIVFLSFFLVLLSFTVGIVCFHQYRESKYRREVLKSQLDSYINIIESSGIDSIQNVLPILPQGLRVSVIGLDGTLLFDNIKDRSVQADNHLERPEIIEAAHQANGSDIRLSKTTHHAYFYFAKQFKQVYIRVATPYNDNLSKSLQADRLFLIFIFLLFLIALSVVLIIANRFGKAVTGLKNFIHLAEGGQVDYNQIVFPNTELGEIGGQIVQIYQELETSKQENNAEKNKLIKHYEYSEIGIAIFSSSHQLVFANSHFVQYLNTIMDHTIADLEALFTDKHFDQLQTDLTNNTHYPNVYQYTIAQAGYFFLVKLMILSTDTFEISISDNTANERTKQQKAEMTSNIAHELRTPISSIRGFVETLLSDDAMPEAKQKYFLERTHAQVLRLSELIQDISLITKMEESPDMLSRTSINIGDVLLEVLTDTHDRLIQKEAVVINTLPNNIEINGNRSAIYGVFMNLIDNTIHYGGQGSTIKISNYLEDQTHYYLSYSNTGTSIEEHHLARLFERFYRADQGRTRHAGGSGLGLSIVKKSILFHGGEISVKGMKGGGVEFLFSLRK